MLHLPAMKRGSEFYAKSGQAEHLGVGCEEYQYYYQVETAMSHI
jgi:hypothetical protein